jgi:hypothetical protein
MKLPKSVKKWIKALRSGKYKQGYSRLATGGGKDTEYCCLGVACELYMKEFPEKLSKELSAFGNYSYYEEGGFPMTGGLPLVVRDWLGLERCNGGYQDKDDIDREISLAHYNDAEKYTFDQIADVIEKDYELMAKKKVGDL